jgi:hypothetical protein
LVREALESGSDWFVCAADNLFPAQNWNELLAPFLEETDRPVLYGYGNQTFRKMVSHPIMNVNFFNQNGRSIMHPEYVHICADVDLYAVGVLSGYLTTLPPSLDPLHNHPLKNGNPPAGDSTFLLTNAQVVYWQGEPLLQARLKELSDQYGKPSPV